MAEADEQRMLAEASIAEAEEQRRQAEAVVLSVSRREEWRSRTESERSRAMSEVAEARLEAHSKHLGSRFGGLTRSS